jgi:hypothetical protein
MRIKLTYVKTTKNYVAYQTEDQDFREGGTICKIWIPLGEIETNIPGVYPENIWIEINGE